MTANQIADEVVYRLLRIKQWIVAICVLIPFTIWYFWLYRPANRWLERMYRLRVPEAYGHYSDPKFGDYRFGSWTKFVREMWNGRPDERQ